MDQHTNCLALMGERGMKSPSYARGAPLRFLDGTPSPLSPPPRFTRGMPGGRGERADPGDQKTCQVADNLTGLFCGVKFSLFPTGSGGTGNQVESEGEQR